MDISVIICTRNRAASLCETLEVVLDQSPSKEFNYEIVVVDNGSTDNTCQVIAELIATVPVKHHGRLRYCFETQPGLSHARNLGLKVAQGDILVFTDDDIWPEAVWLREIYKEFRADPDLHLLGGRVLLARQYLQPVGILTDTEPAILTTPDGGAAIIGANIALRREVFAAVGDFDLRLGAGQFFSGGEDVEYFYRAIKAGFKLKYAPNVTVYHNHDRVTHEQACKLEFNYGKGEVAYLMKHLWQGDKHALKTAYWSLRGMCQKAWGQEIEAQEIIDRTRAHMRGFALGFFPALVRMR